MSDWNSQQQRHCSERNYWPTLIITTLVLATLILPGCQLIANIFAAGLWLGLLLVVGVIVLVVWLISSAVT
jgi:hypothetical protein